MWPRSRSSPTSRPPAEDDVSLAIAVGRDHHRARDGLRIDSDGRRTQNAPFTCGKQQRRDPGRGPSELAVTLAWTEGALVAQRSEKMRWSVHASDERRARRPLGVDSLLMARGYDPAAWQTFCQALVGAAAALTGLLFVAVSINLERILKRPNFLPPRAAETLAAVLVVLMSCALTLVPQNTLLLGIELLVIALTLLAVTPRQLATRRRQLNRPAGRSRGDCPRGEGMMPARAAIRSLAIETNRPVEAVLAAQLEPDGSRSRLLSRRSRASTDAAVHRHAGPAGRMSQSPAAAAASPGRAAVIVLNASTRHCTVR